MGTDPNLQAGWGDADAVQSLSWRTPSATNLEQLIKTEPSRYFGPV